MHGGKQPHIPVAHQKVWPPFLTADSKSGDSLRVTQWSRVLTTPLTVTTGRDMSLCGCCKQGRNCVEEVPFKH